MIEKHTLPNGVRIVAESIPYVHSVSLGLWVGTGSRYETHYNNGISHFLEHMLFKGTKHRTARELAEAFDEIGGHVNAFTSKEMTCYYAKVLDRHLTVALDVLADMYFHSTLAEADIQKEQKVVTEEIKMVEDTPDDIVHDWLDYAAMKQHGLGLPVLGSVENVCSFDRSMLLDYQARHYRPDQLVITMAGKLPANYMREIEERFIHHQVGEGVIAQEPPRYTGEVIVKQKDTEQVHLCLGLPGLSASDPRIYSFILLNNLIGGNMSSRLFQDVREERGLAYSVFSYHSAYRDNGLFTIYAGTAAGQENEVIEIILYHLDDLRQRGITEEELTKGKEQLKASLMMNLESTDDRMSRLGRNELLLNKHLSLEETEANIEAITSESLLELAQMVFSQPLSMAMISPQGRLPATYRRDALVI
ncbi:insulinase family protein [Kroppenstedtia pulmonis]|uniref:Insulinase family protein n=1 Tax=Kroppenstedtia pulmonis TaxID=1380685 RepID=A0A7D4BFR2_9BACL|nr:pitrilysin family protein [Kroppenstedtia pulmonis]QKG84552.1 insulinase family protein [Kroppenstedtia pulmonis]